MAGELTVPAVRERCEPAWSAMGSSHVPSHRTRCERLAAVHEDASAYPLLKVQPICVTRLRSGLGRCVAGALMLLPVYVRAQSTRTDQRASARSPNARRSPASSTSTEYDLLQEHLDAGRRSAEACCSRGFCLISHSPTFEFKHYLDEAELQRDVLRIRLYYWKRGYRETEVDTAVTRRRARTQVDGHVQRARRPADARAQDRDRRTTRR